ncbi:hypothetical protein M514_27385 [Trichuris suis]|uniref:Uncharacterized protein n=1 Tax=Trichuris suis TaxID=68888 RepID=A0A085MT82_9BILA|nr:hypothetical protein M514_27385 [Trichuris suis]
MRAVETLDLANTFFTSNVYHICGRGYSHFVDSRFVDSRFLDRSVPRQVGSSTGRFVDWSFCRLAVLSTGRFVECNCERNLSSKIS